MDSHRITLLRLLNKLEQQMQKQQSSLFPPDDRRFSADIKNDVLVLQAKLREFWILTKIQTQTNSNRLAVLVEMSGESLRRADERLLFKCFFDLRSGD